MLFIFLGRIMKALLSILYIFVFVLNVSLFAKLEVIKDSRGTDFWFTFLPNYHNNWYSPDNRLKYGDSLYIFIASTEPTKGTIEYANRYGQYFVTNFEITDPSKMFIFRIPSYDFALLGYNVGGFIYDDPNSTIQTGKVVTNSFHITSEKEVSVYALSQANTTSDAFMVLPTDVLGNRYFILSYHSDGIYDFSGQSGQSTPSQFAIVAVEDNTNVTIYPKDETYIYGKQVQRINLNRGEVYLVQANITRTNRNSDLTGTEIISSKPIAVFAGHQRATVPLKTREQVNASPSRDILIEQLPPVSTWGKNSIVVPFAKSSNEISYGQSLYRVLAAEDETDVIVDGVKVATLSQGSYYEGFLDKPHFIVSNKPILVGAFKKTCGAGQNYLGDPFFAIMPPVEQYLDEYRVLNAQASEIDKPKVYLEQYITVIIPKVSWESLKIDGLSLSLSDIVDVPGGQYVYANIRVSDGVHYLKADTTFGIVVYGYGAANSYGYIGGSNFLRLNYLEPQITTLQTDSCFIAKGIAFKRRPQDAPLSSFTIVDSLLWNCELYSFLNKSDTIFFAFRLKDNSQDGRFGVFVSDTMNLTSQVLDKWIEGFTFAIEGTKPGEIPIIKGEVAAGKAFCFDVPIVNHGFLPKVLPNVFLKNSKIYPKNYQPIEIGSGEKHILNVCFSFSSDTTFIDTLIIENSCLSLNAMVINVVFVSDREPPRIFVSEDSCLQSIEINISDKLLTDKGLKEFLVEENKNCEVGVQTNYPNEVKAKLRILDYKQDTYFGIVAFDSAGNKVEFWDTIPGFTLTVGRDIEFPIDVGKHYIGTLFCDNFLLNNYGEFPIIIEKAFFQKNLEFSVKPSNFPLIIPPKSTVPLIFCCNPTSSGLLFDTLVIVYDKFCVEWKFPFVVEGKDIQLEGLSKCNVVVSSKITHLRNNSTKAELYPNPAQDILYLELNNKFKSDLELIIYDLFGTKFFSSDIKVEPNSFVEINISEFVRGVYFLLVRINGEVQIFKFEKL